MSETKESMEGKLAATKKSKVSDDSASSGERPSDSGSSVEGIRKLPLLPTRDLVPLPGLIIPILVGEGPAAKAVQRALDEDRLIVMSLQDDESDTLELANVEQLGTYARIVQAINLPDNDLKIRLHVEGRASISSLEIVDESPVVEAELLKSADDITVDEKTIEKISEIKEQVQLLSEYEPALDDYIFACKEIVHPGDLADLIGAALGLSIEDAQTILEDTDILSRLDFVAEKLRQRLELISIKEQISSKTSQEITKIQREEVLKEHLRQIKLELGDAIDSDSDLKLLKERLEKSKLPAIAKPEAERQLRRLSQMHADSSESSLTRTYLEWILDIPWAKKSRDRIDLSKAREILDEDHFGLEKAKERILDFLGVRKLKKNHRGPVLLFVGPPGVGKTSLGRSIAKSLGRKFVRISLGGLRDEAELRGHRRTYVGAMPGRIIQGLKRAGTKNPLFMLDELDKIGSDFRGDPASVLLEILDPEQNKNFEDLYLNIPFDLSEVMFIGTANVVDSIPAALRDRFEIIELSGYTRFEKREISNTYLVPRAIEESGLLGHSSLKGKEITLSKSVLDLIISGYTRESGVRELGRLLNTVTRKLARKVAEGEEIQPEVSEEFVKEALGPRKFLKDQRMTKNEVGVVNGLAWTSVGGETLMVEASITKGNGQLNLTGQQGEVMRESAKTALTFVHSRAELFGIDPRVFEELNLHIHLPQGAIPKDGPSAGIAIVTAIVSVVLGIPVRHDVAMTGEVSLRGNVLEIGGLKEKALAAMRAGVQTVVCPKENQRDLSQFPEHLLAGVEFVVVESAEEVIEIALSESLPLRRGRIGDRKKVGLSGSRVSGQVKPAKGKRAPKKIGVASEASDSSVSEQGSKDVKDIQN